MIKVFVASISALIEPSTAASATTEFAGFLDSAALRTTLAAYRGCTCRCGRFCGHESVKIKQDTQIQLQSLCASLYSISQATVPAVIVGIIADIGTVAIAVGDRAAGLLTLIAVLASGVAINAWAECWA